LPVSPEILCAQQIRSMCSHQAIKLSELPFPVDGAMRSLDRSHHARVRQPIDPDSPPKDFVLHLAIPPNLEQFEHAISRLQVLLAQNDDHSIGSPDSLHEANDAFTQSHPGDITQDLDAAPLRVIAKFVDNRLAGVVPRVRDT
jgi:hypothetical protein